MSKTLYSIESERGILGLVIHEPVLFSKVYGVIKAEHFAIEDNKLIFQAIEEVTKHGRQVSIITILDYLEQYNKQSRENWHDYMTSLIVDKTTVLEIEHLISILREKYQARLLEKELTESIKEVKNHEQPIDSLIAKIEGNIFNVTRDRELKDFREVEEVTSEYYTKLENIAAGNIDESGIKTGIAALDELIVSLKPGDFVLLAARPSMGKTAVSLEMAKNISKEKNVAFFSIEMPSEQIVSRLLASESKINSKHLSKLNDLSDFQKRNLEIAMERVKKLHLVIDDSPSLKFHELAWKARKLKSDNKLDILIIDYIQIIASEERQSRYEFISELSRGLKALARELEVPIIALSQLSRKVEDRDDKRPLMSDIRESGALEQDADMIMFLYRDAYYNQENAPSNGIEDLEILVTKNRNGETGTVNVKFNKNIGDISKGVVD